MDDEYIILTTSRLGARRYGLESFIYRISIAQLVENKLDIEAVASGFLTREAYPVDDDGEIRYKIDKGTITASIDLSNVRGAVALRISEAHTGWLAGKDNRSANIFIENQFGAIQIGGFNESATGDYYSTVQSFCDRETIRIGVSFNDIGHASKITDPFSLVFEYEIRPLMSGIVDCIGIHSDPPLVQVGDTDRPDTQAYDAGYGETWYRANAAYPSSPYTKVERGVIYDSVNGVYVFPASSEASNTWDSGLGLWVYKPGAPGALNRIRAATSDLTYDYIGRIEPLPEAPGAAVFVSSSVARDKLAVHVYNHAVGIYEWNKQISSITASPEAIGAFMDFKRGQFGFLAGRASAIARGELWIWIPKEG
jgi:hypothetical protein